MDGSPQQCGPFSVTCVSAAAASTGSPHMRWKLVAPAENVTLILVLQEAEEKKNEYVIRTLKVTLNKVSRKGEGRNGILASFIR